MQKKIKIFAVNCIFVFFYILANYTLIIFFFFPSPNNPLLPQILTLTSKSE